MLINNLKLINFSFEKQSNQQNISKSINNNSNQSLNQVSAAAASFSKPFWISSDTI
ncbi:hypothetical protein PPL_06254 [Heterostelium album PN500]|uniref:Uncharacterized protein n=1 Tax=Heterostelium pallidum (strain ATCC 26659 / Pp 5 / PN500) TaxID=670386 RepID=D3BCM9_HETP5|nr:hypothetical protein PPL_06254 [Heterostelium album PN500]EFA80671.1 hypothetical protein PPL_06254 [Heterostelium album PN500]|eukprot:XP_020432791.1 hypothetical protein PPL_06254 [Heterostelium album PN500]